MALFIEQLTLNSPNFGEKCIPAYPYMQHLLEQWRAVRLSAAQGRFSPVGSIKIERALLADDGISALYGQAAFDRLRCVRGLFSPLFLASAAPLLAAALSISELISPPIKTAAPVRYSHNMSTITAPSEP